MLIALSVRFFQPKQQGHLELPALIIKRVSRAQVGAWCEVKCFGKSDLYLGGLLLKFFETLQRSSTKSSCMAYCTGTRSIACMNEVRVGDKIDACKITNVSNRYADRDF